MSYLEDDLYRDDINLYRDDQITSLFDRHSADLMTPTP